MFTFASSWFYAFFPFPGGLQPILRKLPESSCLSHWLIYFRLALALQKQKRRCAAWLFPWEELPQPPSCTASAMGRNRSGCVSSICIALEAGGHPPNGALCGCNLLRDQPRQPRQAAGG